MNNFQDYEKDLLQYTQSFMVTEHLGRGQYNKTSFDFQNDAEKFRDNIKSTNPLARIAVYAICKHPTRPAVNLIVS